MQPDDAWQRYGRAVVRSMGEVLQEADEGSHAQMLETADYWLSVGLAIGLTRPADASRLLALILALEDEPRAELDRDAEAFCTEALA
jgi:hypothetical protein